MRNTLWLLLVLAIAALLPLLAYRAQNGPASQSGDESHAAHPDFQLLAVVQVKPEIRAYVTLRRTTSGGYWASGIRPGTDALESIPLTEAEFLEYLSRLKRAGLWRPESGTPRRSVRLQITDGPRKITVRSVRVGLLTELAHPRKTHFDYASGCLLAGDYGVEACRP